VRLPIPAPTACLGPLALAALLIVRTASAAPPAGPASTAPTPSAPSSPTPALTPDRPGFTNGSDTVPPGRVQVEAGLAVTRAPGGDGGAQTTDFPEILTRIGLTPTLELRVQLPDYETITHGGPSGFGDALLGAKIKVYQSKDGNTKAALTPAISIPTGASALSSGHVDPLLTLAAQTVSGARWSLAANVALSDPSGDGTRDFTTAPSGSVSYQLTSALSVYGELYDSIPQKGQSSPITDGGFTYQVNSNLQFDLETGSGLGGGAPVRFYGGGVALRF
jgi:hypothetical protein